jgi:hypothetical protein
MAQFISPLDNIKVASPCPANWDEMLGDERKRYCGQCSLNVYNLSGMTRREAESLLQQSEGRLCVRYFRRADGTVLTKDCPVGWAALKKRLSKTAAAAFSLAAGLLGGLGLTFALAKQEDPLMVGKIIPYASPTPIPLMGDVVSPGYDKRAVMGGLEAQPAPEAEVGNTVMPVQKPAQTKKPKPRITIVKSESYSERNS